MHGTVSRRPTDESPVVGRFRYGFLDNFGSATGSRRGEDSREDPCRRAEAEGAASRPLHLAPASGKKNDPMMPIYIGGGIAAVVLVLVRGRVRIVLRRRSWTLREKI